MVNPGNQAFRLVTGIDDDGIARGAVADHRAAHLQGSDKEGFHHEVLCTHHGIRRSPVVDEPCGQRSVSKPTLGWNGHG